MKRILTILAALLAVVLSGWGSDLVVAKTLFGCDFTDCGSVMPSIGATRDTSGKYTFQDGTDGAVGTVRVYDSYDYDYGLQTFIDDRFKTGAWKDIACVVRSDGQCISDPIEIKGNRDKVFWTWVLDSTGQPKLTDVWHSGDFGLLRPDLATFGPPNNDWKKRCIDNCDLQQKKDLNVCQYRGAIGDTTSTAVGIPVGIVVGTGTTIVATPIVTPLGSVPAGLLTGYGAYKGVASVGEDITKLYVKWCTADAGMDWNKCVTDVCHS